MGPLDLRVLVPARCASRVKSAAWPVVRRPAGLTGATRFACRRERGGFNNDHDRTSGGLRLTRAFRDRSATETDMSSSTAAQMIKAIAARPQLRVRAWD